MSNTFVGEARENFSAVFVAVGGATARVMKTRLHFC